ncbi:MAG: aldehyde dehydrogenase family protein, partial [Candidatus Berkiella sp.]
VDLLSEAKIICGGNHDQENLKIEPTIVEIETFHDKMMENEIFGPILRIIAYKDLDILLTNLRKLPKPLSLYHFSKNKASIAKVNSTLSFGGGCVNDCMMHITNKFLPFGGVGHSGFGAYVGEHGFKTFSHTKSIVQRKRFMLFDFLPVFPAYTESKYRIFKLMARLLGY